MVNTVPRCVFRKYRMNGTFIMIFLIGALTVTGTDMQESKKGGDGMAQKKTVADVLQQHTNELMKISGVTGTGEGV